MRAASRTVRITSASTSRASSSRRAAARSRKLRNSHDTREAAAVVLLDGARAAGATSAPADPCRRAVGSGKDAPQAGALVARHLEPVLGEGRSDGRPTAVGGRSFRSSSRRCGERSGGLPGRNVTHSAPAHPSSGFTFNHPSADTLILVQAVPASKEHALVSEAATATTPASPSPVDDGFRVVQRLVLPADQELDVQSLYVSGVTSFSSGGDSMSRQSGGDYESVDEEPESDDDDSSSEGSAGMSGFGRITDGAGRGGRPAATGDARHLLQRVPGQLLAALDRVLLGPADHPAPRPRVGHRLPVDGQGPRRPGRLLPDRHRRDRDRHVRPAAQAVHRRRLVLVRPRGWPRRAGPRGRHLGLRDRAGAQRSDHHRHHDVQPARLLRRAAGQPGVQPRGARHHRRDRGGRPGQPRRSSTTRATSPPRPISATSCGSSSSPTSAARAASRGR